MIMYVRILEMDGVLKRRQTEFWEEEIKDYKTLWDKILSTL